MDDGKWSAFFVDNRPYSMVLWVSEVKRLIEVQDPENCIEQFVRFHSLLAPLKPLEEEIYRYFRQVTFSLLGLKLMYRGKDQWEARAFQLAFRDIEKPSIATEEFRATLKTLRNIIADSKRFAVEIDSTVNEYLSFFHQHLADFSVEKILTWFILRGDWSTKQHTLLSYVRLEKTEQLIACLQHDDVIVRREAIRLIEQYEIPIAQAEISKLINQETDWFVQIIITRIMGKLKPSPELYDLFIRTLDWRDKLTLSSAIENMTGVFKTGALDDVTSFINDPNSQVKFVVLSAIHNYGVPKHVRMLESFVPTKDILDRNIGKIRDQTLYSRNISLRDN